MPRILNQKGFFPIPIIIIIAALFFGGVAVSTGVINIGFKKSANSPLPSPSQYSEKSESSWESYKNEQYGYSFKHPKGWIVKDQSGEDKREVSVMHPDNLANVLVAARIEEGLKDKTSMEKAMIARKEFKQSEQGLKIANFKSQAEDKKGGWMLVGEKPIDGKMWVFMERGLLDIYGKVLIEQSGYLLDGGSEYKDTLTQILDSFKVE